MGHQAQHQIYNGLDCMLTLEIHDQIAKLRNDDPLAYRFSRALQGPLLDVMQRGFAVNHSQRMVMVHRLEAELDRLEKQLNQLSIGLVGRSLNANSHLQLKTFFYKDLQVPEVWTSKKGEKKLSMDREALEQIAGYLRARPFANHIMEIRDRVKQLGMLRTEVDPDGRMRTSYNIGGTETYRLSSSSSAFGTGSNVQNISPRLRCIFEADPGYKLCVIDLEQAESREVGWICGKLFNDWRYLDACEAGDLHTLTCKLVWPNMPWTGDKKADRALADGDFYRGFSFRDMSKRVGHGCLTGDHEVLTPDGWVPISSKPPVIMQWDQGYSAFTTVSNWIDQPWSGIMHHWEGLSLDALMTDDHRVPYTTMGLNDLRVLPPGKVPSSAKVPLGGGFIGGAANMTPQEAQLIAAFQCDGNQKSRTQVSFHFHKERKFTRLKMLAESAGIPNKRTELRITLQAEGWPKAAGAYLLTWPAAALRAYIEEHKWWDGHQSPTAVSLFSKDREHLEWLQTIGRLLGIGGNIQKPKLSGFGTTMYSLQQNNRQLASLKSAARRKIGATNVQVYCPTVPSGFFYIRRNGKISVTGNSNYYGKAPTIARILRLPTNIISDFQQSYFSAFPAIPLWHRWVAQQLQTTRRIENSFGIPRIFLGRPNEDTTLREAIAHAPQSSTAYRTNLGLYRIWEQLPVQVLAQTHDSVTFQYKETADEDAIVSRALQLMEVRLSHGDRSFVVPGEAKIGWQWSYTGEGALKKWSPAKRDDRKRPSLLSATY